MDPGFIKADSSNLPSVDIEMIHEFFASNPQFVSAETRNVKTERSGRESYGDNAVGYVQLRRSKNICTVKGRITPEHKIRSKNYHVIVEIDEAEERVKQSICTDCAASSGGCKHSVSFLLWLHRRTEEPSVTSKECYWRVPPLSRLGKNADNMALKHIIGKEVPPLGEKCEDFLNAVIEMKGEGGLFSLVKEIPANYKVSIHHMMLNYVKITPPTSLNADSALQFMKTVMTDELCDSIEIKTRMQSKAKLWDEIRFGRITASRLFEASRCETLEGSLFEEVMGATNPFSSEAMKRGLMLEKSVIEVVENERKIKIKQCGIFLNKNFPIFGASPDGLSDVYAIEIKCPSKESTIKNYVKGNRINEKFMAQMQLQMMLTNKKKALFCIAAPTFESSKSVTIYDVDFDQSKCSEMMEKALSFWKHAIFPKCL